MVRKGKEKEATGATAGGGGTAAVAKFACDHPGCGKTYNRSDHLQRHKLNHEAKQILACDQCDRQFVRQDLLLRHLERHAQRGATLGRWAGAETSKDGGGGAGTKKASGKKGKSTSAAAAGQNGTKRRKTAHVEATQAPDPSEDDEDDDDEDGFDELSGGGSPAAAARDSAMQPTFHSPQEQDGQHYVQYGQYPQHAHYPHAGGYRYPSHAAQNGSGVAYYSSTPATSAAASNGGGHAYMTASSSSMTGSRDPSPPALTPVMESSHGERLQHQHQTTLPSVASLSDAASAAAMAAVGGPSAQGGAVLPPLGPGVRLGAQHNYYHPHQQHHVHYQQAPSPGPSRAYPPMQHSGSYSGPHAPSQQQQQQHQASPHGLGVAMPSPRRFYNSSAMGSSGRRFPSGPGVSWSDGGVSGKGENGGGSGSRPGSRADHAAMSGQPNGGSSSAATNSAAGAMPSNALGFTVGQDSFPFAPPQSFSEADYSWLFDGLDPFADASAMGAGLDPAGIELTLDGLASGTSRPVTAGGGGGGGGAKGMDGMGGASQAPTPLPVSLIGEMHGTKGTTYSPVSSDGVGPGPAQPPEAKTPAIGGGLLVRPAPAREISSTAGTGDPSAGAAGIRQGYVDGSFAGGTTFTLRGDKNDADGEDLDTDAQGNASDGDAGNDRLNMLDELAFFASLHAEIPDDPAWDVDSDTHARLLRFLSSVKELHSSTLFAPNALQCYIWLFFRHVNTIWPLVHKPTFDARTADPMLLSAIVVNGMHYSNAPSHALAERIGKKLWGAFVSLDDFRPARATLPMLQALLLTELFGKMMGNRTQHEMGHLFHNFTITLARRNAVFNAVSIVLPGADGSEQQWRAWAREEEKKRAAFIAFMLDSSHGMLFRHIPALSAFQIQLFMPCAEKEWSKSTAKEWYQYRRSAEWRAPTPFLQAVKASLSPAGMPPGLDCFNQYLLLHGLCSISYDLQWKQVNVLMGAESEAGVGDWRERLSFAFSSWLAHFNKRMFDVPNKENNAMYRSALSLMTQGQITLHCDCVHLQIFAGLPAVLGRFLDRGTYQASKTALKEWAALPHSSIAVWHAINFLRAVILGKGPFSGVLRKLDAEEEQMVPASASGTESPSRRRTAAMSDVDYAIPMKWVCYLSALCIWGYGIFSPTQRKNVGAATAKKAAEQLHADVAESATRKDKSAAGGDATKLQHPQPRVIVHYREDEAAACLENLAAEHPNDVPRLDMRPNLNGVLELVYRETHPSRWILTKEASGVLRKLFSQPNANGGSGGGGGGGGAGGSSSEQTATATPAPSQPATPSNEAVKAEAA